MKKYVKIVVLILLAAALLSVFAACGDKEEDSGEAACKIILADKDKNILFQKEYKTESKYLEGLLEELSLVAEDKVSFGIEESAYGPMIVSFSYDGTVYGGEENSFIGIYTSITAIEYVDLAWNTVIGEITYNAAGYGISQMPIIDGETYVFCVETF